jgi:uncharacterized membrane protein
MRSALRREPLLVALGLATTVFYAAYPIARHVRFQSIAWDAGIFDQTVWLYSRFQEPFNTVRGMNILGDHFSPILALLAPLYWVAASPVTLLAVQAALVGVSVVPVFLFARDRVGRTAAYLIAAGYALFWGIQVGVLEFHELAFAPAIVGWMVLWADRGRWRGYFVLLALLFLVKEDMSFLAMGLGATLIVQRQVRYGLITAAAGIAWFYLTTDGLMPWISGHNFQYWLYGDLGPNLSGAVKNVFQHPGLLPHVATDSNQKVRLLLYTFAPFLGLSLYSPLLLASLPVVAERVLSSQPDRWNLAGHYYLPLAPLLAMGAADGLARILRLRPSSTQGPRFVATGAAAAILVANVVVGHRFQLRDLAGDFNFSRTPGERAAARAVERVPDGASVAATEDLLPHLSERRSIWRVGPGMPRTQYIVANVGAPVLPSTTASTPEIHQVLAERTRSYTLMFSSRGFAVWRRRGA